VYSDSEDVSDNILAVMFHNFLKNMNSDVKKVCQSVYIKGRWISFMKYIYGVIQTRVY
jgi:hypothetical protein